MPLFHDEYGCMIKALKSKHKSDEPGYELIDLLRQAVGYNPTTHPENHVDSIRNPIPKKEPSIEGEVTTKALDYMFYFKPVLSEIEEESPSGKRNKLQVSINETRVEKLLMEG